ncbi:MAG: hypothetical protein ACLFT1_08630 [Desulfonatronovibrio sp.]
MLVQNFFQVTPKSAKEIQSELAQGIRTIKIDPDGGGNGRSNQSGQNLTGRKNDNNLDSALDTDNFDKKSHSAGPYEIYNSKGLIVPMKVTG